MRNLRLHILYAKDYWFLSLVITVLTYVLIVAVPLSLLTAIIWFKISISTITCWVHRKRKSKEIFFYMNNGLGERQLLIFAFLTDLVIWILGCTIVINWFTL